MGPKKEKIVSYLSSIQVVECLKQKNTHHSTHHHPARHPFCQPPTEIRKEKEGGEDREGSKKSEDIRVNPGGDIEDKSIPEGDHIRLSKGVIYTFVTGG